MVTAQPHSGAFNNAIALSCSGLPKTLICGFSPATVTPGSNPVASQLTISQVSLTSTNLPQRRSIPLYGAWLLPFGIAGLTFVSSRPSRRRLRFLALGAIVAVGMVTISCGAITAPKVTSSNASHKPTQLAITIHGNSSSGQSATTVNVIVQ